MAYENNEWKVRDIITAEKLNNIETGIQQLNGFVKDVTDNKIHLIGDSDTITLEQDNWEESLGEILQTVPVEKATLTNNIIVVPNDNLPKYETYDISCIQQLNGSLIFKANAFPDVSFEIGLIFI